MENTAPAGSPEPREGLVEVDDLEVKDASRAQRDEVEQKQKGCFFLWRVGVWVEQIVQCAELI